MFFILKAVTAGKVKQRLTVAPVRSIRWRRQERRSERGKEKRKMVGENKGLEKEEGKG